MEIQHILQLQGILQECFLSSISEIKIYKKYTKKYIQVSVTFHDKTNTEVYYIVRYSKYRSILYIVRYSKNETIIRKTIFSVILYIQLAYHNENYEDMAVNQQNIDESLYDEEDLVYHPHDSQKNYPACRSFGLAR